MVPVPPGSPLWPAADCAARCSHGLTHGPARCPAARASRASLGTRPLVYPSLPGLSLKPSESKAVPEVPPASPRIKRPAGLLPCPHTRGFLAKGPLGGRGHRPQGMCLFHGVLEAPSLAAWADHGPAGPSHLPWGLEGGRDLGSPLLLGLGLSPRACVAGWGVIGR